MTNDPQKENKNNSFNQIRQSIELLRQRLNKIEEKIKFQEKAIDLLEISSNCLKNNFYIGEAKKPEVCLVGLDEVMRKAFSKGKVPKILSKGF